MTNDPWKPYRPEEPWKTLQKISKTSFEIPFNPGELSKIPREKKKIKIEFMLPIIFSIQSGLITI